MNDLLEKFLDFLKQVKLPTFADAKGLIDNKHKVILVLITAILICLAFFGLRFLYSKSSVTHCDYAPRLVTDIGAPEKVCPRVCKRYGMEFDTSFSYLSQKLGTQCACCGDVLNKGQSTD